MRCLLAAGADYFVTAIKDNRETIHNDPRGLDFSDAVIQTALDLPTAEWDRQAACHGRRQALRITREKMPMKTGETSTETTFCLTLLGPEYTGAK